MITFQPSALRAPLLADSNHPSPPTTGDPAGFASLLRQNQANAAPKSVPAPAQSPAPAPAPLRQQDSRPEAAVKPLEEAAPETQGASPASDTPPQAEAGHRPHAAAKAHAHELDDRNPSDARVARDKAAAEPAPLDTAPTATNAAKPAATSAAVDPAVAQWLAALQQATPPAAAQADGSTSGTDASSALPTADGHGPRRQAADLKAEEAALPGALHPELPAADPSAFSALMSPRDEPDAATGAPATRVESLKDDSAAGAAALGSAFTPTPTAEVAAPTPVAVATPVDAPDFAHQLGVHLSVLAKDGVQSAELHLNLADMGPVSVQIVMDGTQAHVAFGADQASTRQAIEAGLPQLAGALADAGFTLAGGGVSQHAGGRGASGGNDKADPGAASSAGRTRSVSTDAVARVGGAARRIVTRGGVDLFA